MQTNREIIFLKWANPGLFFVYFRSFQTNIITIFTTNICEKCPSSIQCRDLNPQPLERESLPITSRPGLPSFNFYPLSISSCFFLLSKLSNLIAIRTHYLFDFFPLHEPYLPMIVFLHRSALTKFASIVFRYTFHT